VAPAVRPFGVLAFVVLKLVIAASALAQSLSDFPVPTAGASVAGIAAAPDRNIWFTEQKGDRIGRITPTGVVMEFPLAESGRFLPAGPEGNLWFTEGDGDRIGRITQAGAVAEFAVSAGSLPYGITAGRDDNLWFTEALGDRIGRITPDGVVTEFALPRGTTPNGIATAADGALWFVEFGTNRIGRFAPPGVDTLPPGHRLPREVDLHPGR
jgi:virginiamycin B lyase